MISIKNATINELDLIKNLEKVCPNSDSVLASYKALLMTVGSAGSTIPTIEKPATPYAPAPVMTKTPVAAKGLSKKTWRWSDIGIFEGFSIVNKNTGCRFRVKDAWRKKGGLEYTGRNMAWAKEYIADSILSQLSGVTSISGYSTLKEGVEKTTPVWTQWKVFDQNGVDTGRTVADFARSRGYCLNK